MFSSAVFLALLIGAWFVIRHFDRSQTDPPRPTLTSTQAKWLRIVVYILAATILLSLVCGGPVAERLGVDPLLNRPTW